MHNSLFIRDLIRRTNADPLCVERRDPHRGVARDPDARPGPGEFELTGTWTATCDESFGEAGPAILADLRDFLSRIGGPAVTIANSQLPISKLEMRPSGTPAMPGDPGMPSPKSQISFCPAPDLADRDCRLVLSPETVRLEAGGVAGLWAALAWLEWEMRTRRGPFLPTGTITRRAAWATQISQGPWGGNYSVPDFAPEYLDDDAFRLYAHYGVNAMMIYGDLLCYTNGKTFPELNHPDAERHYDILSAAARRAARYGVKFSYLAVGPKLRPDHALFQRLPDVRGGGFNPPKIGPLHFLCSGHPEVHRFYDETFYEMFRRVPELAGVVLIVAGESFFHCKMRREDPPFGIRCPRCWPEATEPHISRVVGVVDAAVRQAQPKAYTAVWAYTNWGWERPDRRELVRQLPAGVPIFHHIDKDHALQKPAPPGRPDLGGYTKDIWDYSIDFNGVSDSIKPVVEEARAVGRPLFVKTETGIGLEVFQYPYVPAMQHLADKWQNVRAQTPVGVQQSWLFFGMFGSRAEELAMWAAYAPDMPRDVFLHRIAERDFGSGAADLVVESWRHMSASVRHLPCITLRTYYIGPSFLGPSHPLVPKKGDAIPDVFYGYLFYLQELEETFSRAQVEETRTSLVMDALGSSAQSVNVHAEHGDGWEIVAEEYGAAAAEALMAWKLLEQAAGLTSTPQDRQRLREEALLTELIHRTNLTCANVVRFLTARVQRDAGGADARHGLAEMRRLALAERENALGAVHIYREAPWLDLARRTDGHFSPCVDMIEAKVKWIDAWLAER